ncbi:MAG: thioredoxin domain-containing protein [Pseudomonadota bacterium]
MSPFRKTLNVVAISAIAAVAVGCKAQPTQTAAAEVDMSLPRAAAGSDFSEGYEKTELGWAVGAKDAPVTVIEYGSFTCGGCGAFYQQVEPRLAEEFVDTGLVRFEFRSYIRNQADMLATQIAECTGEKKFKGIKNLFFSSQYEWLNSSNPMDYVAVMARKAGVNGAQFRKCTSDTALRNEIAEESQQANAAWASAEGVFSTPTIIVNDAKVEGGFSYENVSGAIERALRSS